MDGNASSKQMWLDVLIIPIERAKGNYYSFGSAGGLSSAAGGAEEESGTGEPAGGTFSAKTFRIVPCYGPSNRPPMAYIES